MEMTIQGRIAGTCEEAGSPFSPTEVYEGVRLDTDDPHKLIPFVDQLLFSLRAFGLKTRPVTIRESKGIAEISWSGRVPKAFRPGVDRLLCISAVSGWTPLL
jgi:hypothetical protein